MGERDLENAPGPGLAETQEEAATLDEALLSAEVALKAIEEAVRSNADPAVAVALEAALLHARKTLDRLAILRATVHKADPAGERSEH